MAVDTTQIMADLAQVQTDFNNLFANVPVGNVTAQFASDLQSVINDVQTAAAVAAQAGA